MGCGRVGLGLLELCISATFLDFILLNVEWALKLIIFRRDFNRIMSDLRGILDRAY